MRKFFRKTEGFTLVELIVVIAILGILAGVGTVGYSGYVKKANMAADQQLINDVANALQLYYYSNPGTGASGYVVLSKDEGPRAPGIAADAMNATFGVGGWAELKLKDDGWDAKAISEAANNPYVDAIPDSVYITDIGTGKVLSDVQNCATNFSQFMAALSASGTVGAVDSLKDHLGATVVDNILADAGYSAENNYSGVTSDVLANATVFGVAQNVKNDESAIVSGFANGSFLGRNLSVDDDLMYVANWYAAGEAFVAHLDNSACTSMFESIDMTGDAATIIGNMRNAFGAISNEIAGSTALQQKQADYYAVPEDGKSQAQLDGEAYVGVMSTVNNLQSDYSKDEAAMKDSALFTSGAIKNRVDSFVAATEMVKELDEVDVEILKSLTGSAAIVRLNADGTVTPIANNR